MRGTKLRYYLAFLYPSVMEKGLHCTHAYFGHQNQIVVRDIIKLVDGHFKMHSPIFIPPVVFDQAETFDDATRVLTTKNIAAFQPVQRLRDIFSQAKLISTKYPDYKPHVTTEHMEAINKPFSCYALMRSGQMVKSWRIKTE